MIFESKLNVKDITFEELLLYVFNQIEINEHKDEIKQVLNAEMIDSVCKCFTGRMSRLINCLNGFDPLVNIEIADNEQIAQVIEVVRVGLERENKYELELHKELVREQLIERTIDNAVIEEWVSDTKNLIFLYKKYFNKYYYTLLYNLLQLKNYFYKTYFIARYIHNTEVCFYAQQRF